MARTGNPQHTLDPKDPFVIDARALGRRAGSQKEYSWIAPAPDELGIEVLTVPVGSPVTLELRLEAVLEGVLVTGTATAGLAGECVRCLVTLEDDLQVDFCELFLYERPADEQDDDEDLLVLEDDLLDLEPLLRDAVVLELPFQPLCREECPGLCVECGARLADDPTHAHEEPIDPRWAALADLTADADAERDTP